MTGYDGQRERSEFLVLVNYYPDHVGKFHNQQSCRPNFLYKTPSAFSGSFFLKLI